jgi:hypothetical protein
MLLTAQLRKGTKAQRYNGRQKTKVKRQIQKINTQPQRAAEVKYMKLHPFSLSPTLPFSISSLCALAPLSRCAILSVNHVTFFESCVTFKLPVETNFADANHW